MSISARPICRTIGSVANSTWTVTLSGAVVNRLGFSNWKMYLWPGPPNSAIRELAMSVIDAINLPNSSSEIAGRIPFQHDVWQPAPLKMLLSEVIGRSLWMSLGTMRTTATFASSSRVVTIASSFTLLRNRYSPTVRLSSAGSCCSGRRTTWNQVLPGLRYSSPPSAVRSPIMSSRVGRTQRPS